MRSERKKFILIDTLTEIIQNIIEKDVVFTILNVSLPQKGGIMKVILSIFPDQKAEKLINELNNQSLKIKNELKKRVHLRYLPKKIIFKYSQELKEMQLVDKILKDML